MSKKANLTIIIQTKNENMHREIQEKMIKKFVKMSKGLGLLSSKLYYKKPSEIRREKIKKIKNKLKRLNNNNN